MLRGLYMAAAGMASQMLIQDTVANNLANVNTSGFKRTGVSLQSFSSLLLNRVSNKHSAEAIGSLSSRSGLSETALQWTPGSIEQTGNPLDVALQGQGFLTVKTKDGKTAYTRNGSLSIGADGTLITGEGQTVLGTQGPIQFPAGAQKIHIDSDGTVSASGQTVGQMKLVSFKDLKNLQSLGQNLFTTTDPALPAPKVAVVQGALERSNVNVVSEMVQNLTGFRVYEALQKTITAQSETFKMAVTNVGKVK